MVVLFNKHETQDGHMKVNYKTLNHMPKTNVNHKLIKIPQNQLIRHAKKLFSI